MLLDFFSWHYSSGTKKFLEIWKNFLEFFWKHYSILPLFLTLFSPWKRDVSRLQERGLHPVLWLTNLIENLMTRIIGSWVRLGVIFFALFLELLTFFAGAILFCLWLILPVAFLISLLGVSLALVAGSFSGLVLSFLIFTGTALVAFFSFKAFCFARKDLSSSNLKGLISEKWFQRVWDRIGINPENLEPDILAKEALLEARLQKLNLSRQEFDSLVEWERENYQEEQNRRRFWLRENLLSDPPLGKYWSFAYTVNLDRYSQDLSERDYSQYQDARLIGKDQDLEELKLLLSRSSQNNVILVGEEGVGKDTLVHTLAKEIRNMRAGEDFNHKRILDFNLKEVIFSSGSKGETESLLSSLFSEAAYAGNVILFISDIHQYLKGDSSEGNEDISEILSQFLAYPTFQIIGTTTPAEFHGKLEKKEKVMKYCEKILVEEMKEEETLKVLLYKLKETEKKRVLFTYKGLKELIKLSDRYVTSAPFPEKALDLLEEIILYWSSNSAAPFIDAAVVAEAVSHKIKVPLGEISESEGEKLLELEKILHQRVVGQDFAIKEIAEAMRRARVGMVNDKKPLGSFLFLGSTGVGKTESAKALAEAYFGSEDRMIRLDMSEYQNQESLDRLIGSVSSGREGYLTSKVKETPYALLLLDEIEKADKDILNLFLQVLDEGALTDAFGKKISFRNLIIIATSNAGAEMIREAIKENLDPEVIQEKVIDYSIKEGIFSPEFLNRFSGVIFFHPLEGETVEKIAALMLARYAEKLKREHNISVEFAPEVIQIVAEEGFDKTFGARNISRFIQNKIEDKIVKKIISGTLQKGTAFIFSKEAMEEE